MELQAVLTDSEYRELRHLARDLMERLTRIIAAHPGLSLHRHRPIRRSSRLPAVRFPAPDSRLQSAGTRASLA